MAFHQPFDRRPELLDVLRLVQQDVHHPLPLRIGYQIGQDVRQDHFQPVQQLPGFLHQGIKTGTERQPDPLMQGGIQVALVAEVPFVEVLGQPEDAAVVGDFDGDGYDDLALRTAGTAVFDIYFINSSSVDPDLTFAYGRPSDVPVAGDWDGDGVDSLGVQRGATFFLRNELSGGAADAPFTFGRAGDIALTGDFDGDGADSIAVVRDGKTFVKNTLAGGGADSVLVFGRATDTRVVGDFFGTGTDTLAVIR